MVPNVEMMNKYYINSTLLRINLETHVNMVTITYLKN